LPARELVHAVTEPVFKAELQIGEAIAQRSTALWTGGEPETAPAASPRGEREIFLNCQEATGADERILKYAADERRTTVDGPSGYIQAVETHCARGNQHVSGQHVQQR
jgi:hypothetical protein